MNGLLGLHLTRQRAATAREMGLSTRRYWLAWAIPFAVWLPVIVYIHFFDHGARACPCAT